MSGDVPRGSGSLGAVCCWVLLPFLFALELPLASFHCVWKLTLVCRACPALCGDDLPPSSSPASVELQLPMLQSLHKKPFFLLFFFFFQILPKNEHQVCFPSPKVSWGGSKNAPLFYPQGISHLVLVC